MEVFETALPGVLLLRPRVFRDKRGFFVETWNKKVLDTAIQHPADFVQDNLVRSARGVLRGLHYQVPPMAQGKLVSVTRGTVFDVAVDMREGSPTRGRWTGVVLDADSREMMWIPKDFAHGFLVLSETAEVAYKATDYYSPEHERIVRWDDPGIGISWPLETGVTPLISAKDAAAPLL